MYYYVCECMLLSHRNVSFVAKFTVSECSHFSKRESVATKSLKVYFSIGIAVAVVAFKDPAQVLSNINIVRTAIKQRAL